VDAERSGHFAHLFEHKEQLKDRAANGLVRPVVGVDGLPPPL
jgi:hypothetical protein